MMAAREQLKKKAYRAWFIVALIAAVWALATVLPAILPHVSETITGSSFFRFFGYICHQMPERSFHIGVHQFGVCSRCFGVYFGVAAGVLAYPLWRNVDEIEPLPRIWLFASIIPMGIDWSMGMLGIWENNHLSRFVTGLILGVGCSTYIVPAVVEITFNLSQSRRSAK
ncbi:MAG: DUF2085 domain-containing protein [Acidobacteria bacterium]|nr:DUF2085 domain-containing protein [Acidobacteriota bacterium]